jgi:Domain of unknown function (DUF1707)
MRAADADRDLVLGALGEAYAEGRLDREEYDERADRVHVAKTLGELPGVLEDLVPQESRLPSRRTPLAVGTVDEQAVARWEKSRREALMGWLIPTVICWVVWSATMFGGFPWPLFPMLGTAIPLLATQVQKKDMIAANAARIVRRQEKAALRLQQQQAKELGRRPGHQPGQDTPQEPEV